MARSFHISFAVIALVALSSAAEPPSKQECDNFFLGFAGAQLQSQERAQNILGCDKDQQLLQPIRNLIEYLIEGKTSDKNFNILTPLLESVQSFGTECFEDVHTLIAPFTTLFEEIKAGVDINAKLMEKAQHDKKSAIKVLGIFSKLKKGLEGGQYQDSGKLFSDLLDIVSSIYKAKGSNEL